MQKMQTNGGFTAYVCDSAATRPSSQITLGKLVKHFVTYITRWGGKLQRPTPAQSQPRLSFWLY